MYVPFCITNEGLHWTFSLFSILSSEWQGEGRESACSPLHGQRKGHQTHRPDRIHQVRPHPHVWDRNEGERRMDGTVKMRIRPVTMTIKTRPLVSLSCSLRLTKWWSSLWESHETDTRSSSRLTMPCVRSDIFMCVCLIVFFEDTSAWSYVQQKLEVLRMSLSFRSRKRKVRTWLWGRRNESLTVGVLTGCIEGLL